MADPYHFDTDPDPGREKIRYGSGSRANFDTDQDPGNIDSDPNLDPAKKNQVPGKSLKSDEKRSYPMFCGCLLLNDHLSINSHLNSGK